MAFLVWLFSFWTWFQAFFRLRWFRTPPLDHATSGASPGVEQLGSNEGQHESALATFLSPLSDDKVKNLHYRPGKDGFKLSALFDGERRDFSGDEPTHREFLAALASSKVGSDGTNCIYLSRDFFDRPEQVEEIVGALVSNNSFKKVDLSFDGCSALQMAECVSNLLLGNKAIEELTVPLGYGEVVGREAAELLANVLRKNRVLKILNLSVIPGLVDDEAMEVLIQPLKENDSVLQELRFRRITDVGLEHLGVMLGTNTSLEALEYWDYERVDDPERRDEPVYMRGFTSLGAALGINRSLERLVCTVGSSMELKVLLEPLMPVNNNPQANTTLTALDLSDSRIGGKEGVDILVDMIRTNTSLLKLNLWGMKDDCPNAVENIVAILEALKANKSLKRVCFANCHGVGGYKVLGSMMDLLLENRQLEEIVLFGTPLQNSGDAVHVYSELEKRKKMKLWDLIKNMADDHPKSGRVFMCGNPYAGE
jgi:hypothetical protein